MTYEFIFLSLWHAYLYYKGNTVCYSEEDILEWSMQRKVVQRSRRSNRYASSIFDRSPGAALKIPLFTYEISGVQYILAARVMCAFLNVRSCFSKLELTVRYKG
jgi:hypothetical protein